MTFEEWKDGYGLVLEPNYSKETEADCLAAFNFGKRESAVLIERQAAQIEMMREALEAAYNGLRWWMDAFPLHVTEADNEEMLKIVKALAIQPDDAALKAWLGEPHSYLYKFNSEFGDGTFWSHRPTHNGADALETIPLYKPKELK